MGPIKWLLILNFFSNFKREEASCKHESTKQHQDLFACEFSQFGPNNSITTDGDVSVGSKNKRKFQNQTLLCSTSSSSDTYLEIKLKHFYDVCAVSVWTNTPSFNLTNFKIQYLNYGKFWEYYEEMGQVKDFQGVTNDSGISLHHIQLTTKEIRFSSFNWKKGTCLRFAIHGNIALCAASQRRMDLWCNKTISYQNASHPECSGELRARFDRNEKSSRKMWRCYHESALTPDLSGYDDNLRSPCYYSRNSELKKVLKSCSKKSSSENCPLNRQDRNRTSMNLNISETIANLNKIKDSTTQRLTSRDILKVVHVLENVSSEELLGNTSQHNRDHFAKTFLEVASALLNETYIPTWTSSLANSSTLSRLLKVVEDFGEAFTKYLECSNETEKIFSFVDIKFIAKSCVNVSSFPLKLTSSRGCRSEDDSHDICNAWSNIMDSATLPESLMDDQQQYQVSFVSYKNAHRFFPVEPTEGTTLLRSAKVDSRILSFTVKPEGLVVKENPVTLTLEPFSNISQNENDFHCGFWNFSALGTANGAWSTDGCKVLSINTSQVTCQCDHLTNFALLILVDPDSANQGIHQEVLMWMAYLGCSFSLAAEILCMLAFSLLTSMKETKVKIHVNLVACLAAGHLLFLTAIERATVCKLLCRVVAVSLHYFFLASFMWMLVEGIHLLSRLKTTCRPKHELPLAYSLGYGLSLAIVGGTFAVKFNEYGSQQHCWLSVASGAIWSFIVPVCGVILVNFFVLALVLRRLTGTQMFRRRNERQKIRLTVRASLTILPLLGLSWFFGLMAVNQETIVFQYLFVVFNSLQGVFLFVFHCAVNTEVRRGVRSIMRRRRVTQQVVREASKPARSQDNNADENKQKSLLNAEAAKRYSIPLVFIDQCVEVVQSVRLTRVIQRSSSLHCNRGYRQDHNPDDAPTKHAWGD